MAGHLQKRRQAGSPHHIAETEILQMQVEKEKYYLNIVEFWFILHTN